MWGTLTTISPSNPLIRWPELAKSNLGEADGGAEQRRRLRGGRRCREHSTVRVNQGTHELLSLDHRHNDRGWVDCYAAKTHTHTKKHAHTKGYYIYTWTTTAGINMLTSQKFLTERSRHPENTFGRKHTILKASHHSPDQKCTCHKIKNENMASLPHW